MEKYLWCLETADFLKQLTPTQTEEFSKLVHFKSYGKGEVIFLPNDLSNTIYFLNAGAVKLYYLDESGRRFTLKIITKKGQPFGLLSLAEEGGHQVVAQATRDTRLCMISRQDFMPFVKVNCLVCCSLIKVMGSEQREIQTLLADLVFKPVSLRLAKTLIKLSKEFGQVADNSRHTLLRFTHQDLADLVGATREGVTTILNQFQRQKIIEKSPGKILILDQSRLDKLIE